ncbi:hypothetical protein L596_030014 [Steinernema carpocapsae]|uniref:Uncharacterized protein n=1 Tax=Steinernema carpocapsae TaxID=34508 RepID=A0A4U5LRG5_STECR|nr:hypothetical protein L596_030014 [Steinernema carpocapsae]
MGPCNSKAIVKTMFISNTMSLTEHVQVTVAVTFAFARFSQSPRTGRFCNRDGVKIRVANAKLSTVVFVFGLDRLGTKLEVL